MTKGSTKTASNKHLSTNKTNTTSAAIRATKQAILTGPDVENNDGQKQKSISEINGIPTLHMDDGMVEDVVEDSESDQDAEEEKEWYQRHGKKGMQVIKDEPEDLLQLDDEDVHDEIEYSKQAVYGFIVGANPPWQILEGFLKRIWNKYVIDKLSFLPNEVFIARFQTDEMKQAVLNSGHFLFDNKPMIIKPWVLDIELIKEEVKSVPAWIRLHKLPLKFWGKSLVKLANLVGTYIKSDSATEQKTRLGFARVMVELKIGQKFPKSIKFLDEKQHLVEIELGYEWKPVMCSKCKQLGHEKENCRKGQKKIVTKVVKKEWKPVQKVTQVTQTTLPAQQPAKIIQSDQNTEDITRTPEHKPGPGNSGSISPIKVSRPGSPNGSRIRPGSPSYMEALSGSNSPKQGIGVNGLFGLLETKIKPSKVNKAVANVFQDWSVSTNTAYHSGGRIWVVWKPHLYDVSFLDYDAQYIHMRIADKSTGKSFFYTVIYAFNGINDMVPLWISLKRMSTQVSGPWLVGGDFNCVLQAKERLGGSFNMAEAEPFQQCLEDCEVMDIQATGSFYTWNNKQPVETRVYSRLDRALVNQHWTDQFPTVYANFLPEGHFDHNPCLIGLADSGQHRNMPFKYFNMWSLSPDFHNCVSISWQYRYEGTKMFRVIQKLRRLKPALKSINRSGYSNIENQAMLPETQLFQLQ
ncbi:uncharacterized protein LOC141613582 [Silene latifolia]|uniref:uncharacterized protein LOC141613582 n=1 Tax=Silene latifolia TaxID=37657 RepID=UPI003D7766EB